MLSGKRLNDSVQISHTHTTLSLGHFEINFSSILKCLTFFFIIQAIGQARLLFCSVAGISLDSDQVADPAMAQLQFLKGNVYEHLVARETMLGMLAGYLLMIVGLRSFMKSRAPYSLKLVMQVYNLVQVLLNVYMIWGLCVLPFLSESPNLFGINARYTDRLEFFVLIHYLSKYLDYFDTVFIILRGKEKQQLSFLHVYHHASIGMIWGALLHIGHGNGTAVSRLIVVKHSMSHGRGLCSDSPISCVPGIRVPYQQCDSLHHVQPLFFHLPGLRESVQEDDHTGAARPVRMTGSPSQAAAGEGGDREATARIRQEQGRGCMTDAILVRPSPISCVRTEFGCLTSI